MSAFEMRLVLLRDIPQRFPVKTFCLSIAHGAVQGSKEMLGGLFGDTLGIRSALDGGDWNSPPSNLPHV